MRDSAIATAKEWIGGSQALFDGMAWAQLQSDIADSYVERITMYANTGSSLEDAINDATSFSMVFADLTGISSVTEAWEGRSLLNGSDLTPQERAQRALEGGGQALLSALAMQGFTSNTLRSVSGANGLGRGQSLLATGARNGALRKIAACRARIWHNNSIQVYRGINSTNFGYSNGLNGIVRPNNIFGKITPLEHNTVTTLGSPYTSWTTDLRVATNFALRPSQHGIVISMRVKRSLIIKSPNTKSVSLVQGGGIVSESEVLLKGTIKVSENAITIIELDFF